MRDQNMLIVKGANLKKRHVGASEAGKGGIFKVEGPVHYSAVSLVDPVTK